jgi:hypothetical protein
MPEITTTGDAPGGLTVQKVLGTDGNNLYLFPVSPPNTERITYVNASRAITAADLNGGGVLVSTSPVTCVLTLPTMWRLGKNHANTKAIIFAVCREGLGLLLITPAKYKGSFASQAAMLAMPSAAPEDYCWRSDANGGAGQMFILTTGLPNVLANWVAVPPGDANRPVIPTGTDDGVMVNWGLTSQYDPQYLEQDMTVAIESKSLDHWKGG